MLNQVQHDGVLTERELLPSVYREKERQMITGKCTVSHVAAPVRFVLLLVAVLAVTSFLAGPATSATTLPRYYAYPAVHDAHGVIAPWYTGLNGQCDYRVRIAAETLKRYPWTTLAKAVTEVPEYVFNPGWTITEDGTITPGQMGLGDGDLGCRAWVVLVALAHYYRYSGDPAALAHMTYTADVLLDYSLTPADHPWPGFLISAPFAGASYGQADPHGYIQLDFTANCGIGLIKAYQITGITRYLDAAKHWADLLAQKRNKTPGADPWGRYANPEDVPWCSNNKITGGVASFVLLFDELIRLGYTGTNNDMVEARDAALAYIRDKLLPVWTVDDTWGRSYNDWDDPVQAGNVTEAVSWVMMAHKDYFPNWKSDVRNILALFMHRTSVDSASGGDVYSGSWAYPESSGCCGRSLWYATLEVGATFAQYGVEADSEWGRELARRQEIHSTYDVHESGVTEDNIDGGCIVNSGWFKIAVPEALWFVLSAMSWLPEDLGPNRENHIMRTSGTVTSVVYAKGKISYSTFDAPANSVDVMRLAFAPTLVKADGVTLSPRGDLASNGYTVNTLPNGDCIVSIRHDGSTSIVVTGTDPQSQANDSSLTYSGTWTLASNSSDYQGSARVSESAGAFATYAFTGNQVRLIGRALPTGGLADVYIDGVKQLVFVDCYSPTPCYQQVIYYKNGLSAGSHTIKLLVRGAKNPKSTGAKVYIDALQYSGATGDAGYGSGGGPTGAQRWIFGRPGNQDYVDSSGNAWSPATEWTSRLGFLADIVSRTWWWGGASQTITNTPDPELYRYGAHAPDFTANFTVGPGTYHARLKFAATAAIDPVLNHVTIDINGQRMVTRMDVAATAGGINKAVDLVFNGITPRNGIIDIRFTGGLPELGLNYDAFVQAVEIGPGDDPVGNGATPVTIAGTNLLVNPGFEDGVTAGSGHTGTQSTEQGWSYRFSGPSDSTVRAESSLASEPSMGPPEYAVGAEAVRIGSSGSAHSEVYQDAAVRPDADYLAGVWVRARDLDGQGFGRSQGDSAGIIVRELDSSGNLVAEYPKQSVSVAGSYVFVATRLHTTALTATVRFVLDTVVGCTSEHGSVTYDGCLLDGPMPTCRVEGTVTSRSLPMSGATVTLGSRSVVTGVDGKYAFDNETRSWQPSTISASKAGYYVATVHRKMSLPVNTINFGLVTLPENNLLTNPGWESGAPKGGPWEGANGSGGMGYGWSYSFPNANKSYFEAESDYYWRWKFIHSGSEAMAATVTQNGRCVLAQTVNVLPNSDYTASVWVMALDWDGQGFGHSPTDSAGMIIKELDSNGNVVLEHPNVAVTHSTDQYECLSLSFTTRPETARIVYMLDSVIGCAFNHGGVIYDDSALDGPTPGGVLCDVTGTVISDGSPVSGVTVALGSRIATTGADGTYVFRNATVGPSGSTIAAYKPGYFTETKHRMLAAPVVVVDFEIVRLPEHNLLANPGWELGAPKGFPWQGTGGGGGSGYGWSYSFPSSNLSYFEAESDYLWRQRYYHSGAEAIAATVEGQGRCVLSQTVDVLPNAEYKAAVWVLGLNLDGQGFGAYPTDSAGLAIRELSSSGSLILDRGQVAVTVATPDFAYKSMSFVTRPNTAKVVYTLDATIGGRYTHGGVIYDDSILEGPVTVSGITEAKAMPDRSVIRLRNVYVTALYADRFYIEDAARAGGLAVGATGGIGIGDRIDVIGKLATIDGERFIVATSVALSAP